MSEKITSREFMKKVNEIEGIKLILYTILDTPVDDYNYLKAASDNTSLSNFLNTRIKPKISGIDYEVINGDTCESTHGLTLLGTLRKSYIRS